MLVDVCVCICRLVYTFCTQVSYYVVPNLKRLDKLHMCVCVCVCVCVSVSLACQVSSSSFLSAAQTRWRRGSTRRQALVHMRELLTAAVRVGGVTHLVGPVTMVLQGGPR